ncbi:putative class ii aldolase adducin domain-containing protein [Phaeomoniella chlamydospora]|uniref:Putative class ii aldolase adducin domain-containing protein n=1 Tax=Phaeomoniella chlamydospora TaxID=158046 RepID=A0A0G2E1F2_PHACM|nr:putative class ii aldolase adducin domain-containing protein [Phaeomoniella chlamydospora]
MSPAIIETRETLDNPSGDPDLAFPHDDVMAPPVFKDKYAERKYLKHRLVLAFRIFAQFKFAEGVAGHITLRDPVDPHCFWVNAFGQHFSTITDDDLILVTEDGKVIDGGKNRRLNYAAFAIHSEIHAARPDVICAAHSHSTYGRAFCATGRTLDMLTQDHCVFYNDHVLYDNFAGLVLSSDEGKHIAQCLGGKKAALLGNHGLLTVGKTIEEVTAWFVLLEKCCKIQLLADASSAGSGKPLVKVGEAECKSTWKALDGNGKGGYFMGLPLFQVAEKEFGEATLLGRGTEPL